MRKNFGVKAKVDLSLPIAKSPTLPSQALPPETACLCLIIRGNEMATSKDYLGFISDQLSEVEGITYRQMMGEYIIYLHGKIAAYVCDDRLLVKPVKAAFERMPNATLEPPYEGAKDMLLVDNVDDKDFLKELFETIYPELPEPKKKRK